MAILVTGGAGYIGSHTAVELLNSGKEIIIIDNFSNSKREVLDKIKEITGKNFKFYEMDYKNIEKLERVFEENKIDAVMNFAGYKAPEAKVNAEKEKLASYTEKLEMTKTQLDNILKKLG